MEATYKIQHPPTVIVMAKPPVPGWVKTRLIGKLDPHQAAAVHAAMLECVLRRVPEKIGSICPVRYVLALDKALGQRAQGNPRQIDCPMPQVWQVIDQGGGDLGRRVIRVWQETGGGPAMLLGVDSPDLPAQWLRQVLPAIESSDAAIGPAHDGGYWTLAAARLRRQLLDRIDWGSRRVYHQTLSAARAASISMVSLPKWYDVDDFDDLEALRERIRHTDDPFLACLQVRLGEICKDGHS